MRPPSKFVSCLTDHQISQLEKWFADDSSRRVRQRAQAILLSSRGFTIKEIAHILQTKRDTISTWIDRWEQQGMQGLQDRPRSGRPPKLTEAERQMLLDLLQAHPQSPRTVLASFQQQTGKSISRWHLRQIAKSDRLSWKRVRRSMASQRDEQAFREAEQELQDLKKNTTPERSICATSMSPGSA